MSETELEQVQRLSNQRAEALDSAHQQVESLRQQLAGALARAEAAEARITKAIKDRDMEWWEACALVDNVAPEPKAVSQWHAVMCQHSHEEGVKKGLARAEAAERNRELDRGVVKTVWATHEKQFAEMTARAETAERACASLVDSGSGLIDIVEGVLSERWACDGKRFKDTQQWAKFYVLIQAAKNNDCGTGYRSREEVRKLVAPTIELGRQLKEWWFSKEALTNLRASLVVELFTVAERLERETGEKGPQ